MNLPTKDDIEKLNKKIQNLSNRVKKLGRSERRGAGRIDYAFQSAETQKHV